MDRADWPDISRDAPVVVISPHLDDAVFGCGRLLAAHPRSVVITALAGKPPSYDRVTDWDAAAGFQPGDDVVGRRYEEDVDALQVLDARPIWLDFLDGQYDAHDRSPLEVALTDALEGAILATALTTAFIPLGLFHPDHALVHAAGLGVMRRRPDLTWFDYEEPIYRRVPGAIEERRRALAHGGIIATPIGAPLDHDDRAKRRAVRAYRSQMRALVSCWPLDCDDIFAPERYWRLACALR